MNRKMSSQETPMFWKVEPLSPSGTPPPSYDDEEWLFLDEKPAVLVQDDNGEEAVLYEEQLTRAQIASKFLEELEIKPWVKEESFADWLEEKIDIPIFEDIPAPECGQNRAVTATIAAYPAKPQPIHVVSATPMVIAGVNGGDTTQSLLREFETVLGDVEACHQIASTTTLTPPQSPPPILCKQQQLIQPQAHLLVSLQPIHHQQQQQQQAFVYEQQQHHHQYHEETAAITTLHGQPQASNNGYALSLTTSNNSSNNSSTNESISHHQQQQHVAEQWSAENLSLDPLVHSGDVAQELAQVDEYVRSCAEDVAPSPSCSSTSCSSEDSSDPDWSFESSSPSTSSSPRKITPTGRGSGGRRGSKPYSRPNVEDKRVRKKEQNKNAATRYRQKKKQEIKEIVGEEQELNNKNEELQAKVKDLQREIGYLKGLMRDLFKAKGLMK